jgi:hypothetical protein
MFADCHATHPSQVAGTVLPSKYIFVIHAPFVFAVRNVAYRERQAAAEIEYPLPVPVNGLSGSQKYTGQFMLLNLIEK